MSARRASPSASVASTASASSSTTSSSLPSPRTVSSSAARSTFVTSLDGERLEHEHARAREQRAIDLERWILRRRADERDGAALDVREKRILLRAIQAMDLVDEEHRAATAHREPLLRCRDDLAHARHAFGDRGERDELALRVVGDEQRERRLAAARRPPEEHRRHLPALDRLAQRHARREQMLLSDELVERCGTHARRERLGARRRLEQRRRRRAAQWVVRARSFAAMLRCPRRRASRSTARIRRRTRAAGASRACPEIRERDSKRPRTASLPRRVRVRSRRARVQRR